MRHDIKNTIMLSDLDGTLLPHGGEVCSEDRAAIEKYIADGGHFAIATGRMPDMLEWVYKLGANIPCIISNGAVIYDFSQKKVVLENFLDDKMLEALPRAMDKFPGLCAQMRVLDKLYVARPNKTFEWHISWEKQKYELVDYKKTVHRAHKMLLLEEHGVLEEVRELLQSEYPGAFDFVFSCDVFLEVIPKNSTKGDSAVKLKKLLGMENAPLFALGDYGNDVKLLSMADVSGCPSTAVDEVKRIANFICAPVGKGCAAEFIGYLYKHYFYQR